MNKILTKINLYKRTIGSTQVKCLRIQKLLPFKKNNQITTASHTITLINKITINKIFNMIGLR